MSKYTKNPFVISGLFLIFAIIFLFIFFNRNSRNSLIEQVQHRQQLSVRLGSELIENLLNSVGKSLLMISNKREQAELDLFVKNWNASGIVGITFLNKDGIVTKSSNILNLPDLGQNLSDREYFKWAKKSLGGEYKVFTPILSKRGPSKGTYVIPIARSVISANKGFDGVLVTAIPLSSLTSGYLNNIKVLDSSKIYIITDLGEIIYSDDYSKLGKKIDDLLNFEFLGKNKVLEILFDNLKNRKESKLELALPNLEKNNNIEPYIISDSPLQVSEQHWKLVVITAENDLSIFTFNLLNRQMMIVFIVTIAFILLTLRVSKNSGYNEAVKDEHKIHKITS